MEWVCVVEMRFLMVVRAREGKLRSDSWAREFRAGFPSSVEGCGEGGGGWLRSRPSEISARVELSVWIENK